MNIRDQLQMFSQQALSMIAKSHGHGSFSTAQKLSFLIGLSGIRVIDAHSTIDTSTIGKTYTLVYTDPTSRQSNYQTVCVPEYAEYSPFSIEFIDDQIAVLRLATFCEPFGGIDLNQGFVVRRHATITAASNHYYSRVDPHLNEVPTATIISPYSTCAEACLMCSRSSARTFLRPTRGYLREHVEQVAADYTARQWRPTDMWSANLTTGSHATAERELNMITQLFEIYREYGFENVRFHTHTYQIQLKEHMRELLSCGAIGYIGTLETFDDARRLAFWGRLKGSQKLDDHRRRYVNAHDAGYPIVETNYVIGTDSYVDMIAGLELLDREGVAVVPNIMRNYTVTQLGSLHADLWRIGYSYVLDGFEAAVATYRHPTIKAYAGNKTVTYLNDHGWDVKFVDLPIRHT